MLPGMRCGVCGSERLSPIGELRASQNASDRIRLKFPRQRRYKLRPRFEIYLARACRDCGVVIPFLDDEDRERLDSSADGLSNY